MSTGYQTATVTRGRLYIYYSVFQTVHRGGMFDI